MGSTQNAVEVAWVKENAVITNDSVKLLCSALTDNWTTSNVHACCDDKGPTVTVIKKENDVLGGFPRGHGVFMESLYQVLGVKKADVDGMLSLKGSTAGALAVGLSKKKW